MKGKKGKGREKSAGVVRQNISRLFRDRDQDANGFLENEELKGLSDVAAMDWDKDGRVTKAEAFGFHTNREAPNPPTVVAADRDAGLAEAIFEEISESRDPGDRDSTSPWPQFLGPDRDGISRDPTPLARSWPPDGPAVLWRKRVGGGFGGAAVVEGRVMILDRGATNEESLRCFDLTSGDEMWRFRYPTPNVRLPFSGSRTVPAVEGDRAWILGTLGDLHCLDWKNREVKWHRNLLEVAGLEKPPRWGVSHSPLLSRDLVIVPAIEDESGFLLGIEKETGETRWKTENIGGSAYMSPVLHDFGGVPQVLTYGRTGQSTGQWTSVVPESGEILWQWDGYYNGIQVVHPVDLGEGRLFLTGGYDLGSQIIRVRNDGNTWQIEKDGGHELAGCPVHAPLLWQGHLYANLNTNNNLRASRRKEGGIGCLDLEGNLLWNTGEDPNFDRGSILIADGLLFALDGSTGELMLVDPVPEGYRELARCRLIQGPEKRNRVWAPMAISNGSLLVRTQEELICLDVRKGSGEN